MAIQTIKATMQMRHGLEEDLEPDQLTTGEWAVSTDARYVRMCFAPGIVLRMATYEAFEQDMKEIQAILATCQDIQVAVERFEQLAEQHASQAETWSVASESWAVGGTGTREGEDTDNSKYYSEQSKNEADRAKNEADRAASIVNIDIDSELSETSANPVQNRVITRALREINVDISDEPVEFTEAELRSNIQSGEKIPILFGKIKKVFSDLQSIAFTGSYADLKNKPDIPEIPSAIKNPHPLTFTGAVTGSYDGSTKKTVDIPSGVNNLLATDTGHWLDATQGKVLNNKIAELLDDIDILNGADCATGSALIFRAIPSGQNPTYGAYSTGLYVYGGYVPGAPSDWAGVILSLRTVAGIMKYAFTFGGQIYFMRHKTDGTVEQAWTLV